MPSQHVHDRIHRARSYLREHTVVRFFALPILLMASILLLVFLASSRTTPLESVSVVGLFVVASVGVVGISVFAERVLASFWSA